MVYIIKKHNVESNEKLLKRVAALMINIEYNRNIFNIHGDIKLNSSKEKEKKFNTVKYEFFDDTYTFNCGTIIFTDSLCSEMVTESIILGYKDIIENHMKKLDVYENDTFYKPCSWNKHFMTTQYCVIWKKIPAYTNERTYRRILRYNNSNSCTSQGLCESYFDKFIWDFSPISCLNNIEQSSYKHTFRSLSTIIVDTQNILRYNDDMTPITKSLSYNINYPICDQVDLLNKKILNFTVNIDQTLGISKEFIDNFTRFYVENLKLSYYKIDFKNVRLSSIDTNEIITEFLHNPISSKIPIVKKNGIKIDLRIEKSSSDICSSCMQPLFDDIYVIEKKSNKVQIALCVVCFHYNAYISTIYYKKDLFNVLVTKIPRNVSEAIDLMNKPTKVQKHDFDIYKKLLKIINKKFPKELDLCDIADISSSDNRDIQIDDNIVLCIKFKNIWNNLYRASQLKHKIIIPITLS